MKFNNNTSEFNGTIKVDTSIEKPTEIYTNAQYYYPNGFDLQVLDDAGN